MRAVDHQVGGLSDGRRLRALARDGTPGYALGAQFADGGEGREITEVVTAEQHRLCRALGGERTQCGALVHTGRPELKHHPARFDGQPCPHSEAAEWLTQQRECRRRVCRAPGVHGKRGALVLDCGSLRRGRLGEQPGQRLPCHLDTGRYVGCAEDARLPSLHSIVTEHDEAWHVGEAAKCHRVRRGPAGDDRHRADTARQPGERGRRARRGHRRGRVGDDRRESAVVVGGHQRAGRAGHDRGEPGTAV